jgi:RimJ/RimL family protein N-acetyltransferase
MQTMLKTDRLFLVPATLPMLDAMVECEWPRLSALLGGVDFADNWYHFPEAFAWLRDYAVDHSIDFGWWNYLIIHQSDTRVIGTCGYKGAPDPGGLVEIGYEIAESYWGRGFATEAAKALCQHAMTFEAVRTICAHTLAEENASVALLRKIGFEFLGEIIDIEDGKIWEWRLKRP